MTARCLFIAALVMCLACDDVDRCLDAGGRWDYANNACAYCDPETAPAACLTSDFARIYQNDRDQLWLLLDRSGDRAAACLPNSDTSSFLSLALTVTGNAEVGEAFAERVEKLLLSNPQCLLAAAEVLPDANLDALVEFYLRAPVFVDATLFSQTLAASVDAASYPRVHARLTAREGAG